MKSIGTQLTRRAKPSEAELKSLSCLGSEQLEEAVTGLLGTRATWRDLATAGLPPVPLTVAIGEHRHRPREYTRHWVQIGKRGEKTPLSIGKDFLGLVEELDGLGWLAEDHPMADRLARRIAMAGEAHVAALLRSVQDRTRQDIGFRR